MIKHFLCLAYLRKYIFWFFRYRNDNIDLLQIKKLSVCLKHVFERLLFSCLPPNISSLDLLESLYMSLVMRKPAFCIFENKDADQLRSNCTVTAQLISAFVFA